MKTTIFDFVLCGFVITLILGGSLSIVLFLITPFTKIFLNDFHVIADLFLFLLCYGLLSGMIIQLMIKIKPLQLGEFFMDHPNFTYWKLLTITYKLGEFFLLPFTTVFTKPLVVKLFGAKIGKNVAIGGVIDNYYLISIGDDSIIGTGSLVSGNTIVDGKIFIGKVNIGKNVTIGMNAIVLPDTEIGDNSILSIGAVLISGVKVPNNEVWRGNPARTWQAITTKNSSIIKSLEVPNEPRNYRPIQPIKNHLG